MSGAGRKIIEALEEAVRGSYARVHLWGDKGERMTFYRETPLIVASPELLEALKKAREYVAKLHGSIAGAIGHENTIVKPDLDLIDAAIAKAEGKPE